MSTDRLARTPSPKLDIIEKRKGGNSEYYLKVGLADKLLI